MREDYGSLNLVTHDDGFGDMGFDTDNPDIMREAIGSEAGLEQVSFLFFRIGLGLPYTYGNTKNKIVSENCSDQSECSDTSLHV